MRIILFFLLTLFTLSGYAEISQPQQGVLPNGLRYTLLPLHNEKNHIEIRIKVYAGAVDEEDSQLGVAHMLEHLVFQASEKYPQGVMNLLHSRGWVRAKHYNAVTTNDHTAYMMTIPPNNTLSDGLDALSQMLFFAKLRPEDLDKERKIILEEWRQGQGVGQRMNRQRTNIIRANSRYTRSPVIGTPENIKHMPVEQLQNFYQQWYVPNNMQLIIIGDIDIADTKQLLEHYFAGVPEKKLITRNYYDPQLTNTLHIAQLQDAQSSVSQVAYIFRFSEDKMLQQTDEGKYLRLLDKIALSLVTQRLRNQKPTLPKGVESLVLRKADIGKTTVALGIFSSVDEQSHRQGLSQIFTEIKRLKDYPITKQELDAELLEFEKKIAIAKNKKEDREFSEWVKTINDTIWLDKPYLSQKELAHIHEKLLPQITLQAINQHIQHWFEHKDRIIQYQAPRLTPITPISEKEINELLENINKRSVEPPQNKKKIDPIDFPKIELSGEIIKENDYPKENVTYFFLSNGDKVVWLKSNKAKDYSYIQIQNNAGYDSDTSKPWQSQITTQLLMQNMPYDWNKEQLDDLKLAKKLNLSITQHNDKLIFTGSSPNKNLSELLQLYYAYQKNTTIKEGLSEAQKQIDRTLNLGSSGSLENQKTNTLLTLRYGKQYKNLLPSKEELNALTYSTLNQIWANLSKVQTTYYLVNNMDIAEIRALITKYLAPIERGEKLTYTPKYPLEGSEISYFPFNLAPKNDIAMYFFTPYQWNGKDAASISLLKQIITTKLKNKLRDEKQGLYSLKFDTTLNPYTQRIESELRFTADPNSTEMLISLVKMELKNLSQEITFKDIEIAKSQFVKNEADRLNSPHSWLSRLILSDQKFGNPNYLSEFPHLSEEITLEHIRTLANRIYSEGNLKIFITTPLKK